MSFVHSTVKQRNQLSARNPSQNNKQLPTWSVNSTVAVLFTLHTLVSVSTQDTLPTFPVFRVVPMTSEMGTFMKTFRNFLGLLVLPALFAITNAGGNTLVLLDNLAIKETHSLFFKSLQGSYRHIWEPTKRFSIPRKCIYSMF